jgi:polyisoprenoid-binding protein YceI
MKRTHSAQQYRLRGSLPALAFILGVILPALAPLSIQAEPARYEIDPEHLSIGFLVDHIGYARTLGMFRKAEGAFRFDEQTGELTNLKVVVDTASVFSNHKKRDEHLRSTGERTFVIPGQLELLGKTRPMTLEATWNKSAEYPFGGGLLGGKPYVMGVSAQGRILRSEFGMSYAVDNGWVGDEVELIIEFEARRQ